MCKLYFLYIFSLLYWSGQKTFQRNISILMNWSFNFSKPVHVSGGVRGFQTCLIYLVFVCYQNTITASWARVLTHTFFMQNMLSHQSALCLNCHPLQFLLKSSFSYPNFSRKVKSTTLRSRSIWNYEYQGLKYKTSKCGHTTD